MEDKIVTEFELNGIDKSINSIKELKAELKSAQSAALNGDGKAAKRVAELKDKMDDLKDSTKSFQGSGVEKIGSGFNLLGQGFKDMDLDKIKTGFKGLGSAMSAIPIFLIIEGISYLVEHFEELSKGSGVLATILRSVSDAVHWLIDGFTDLIGATNESERAIEKQGEAMVKANEDTQAALSETTSEFDRQLAVAKIAGKSTIEIEKAKQQAIIDTNIQIAKGIEAQVRAGGEFTDDMKKQLSGSLTAIKNAKVNEYVAIETDNKAKQEQYKKHNEEIQKEKDRRDAQDKKSHDDLKAFNKARQEQDDKEEADAKAAQDKLITDMRNQTIANQISDAQKEVEIIKAVAQQKRDIQMAGLNAASQIIGLAAMLGEKNKAIQKGALIAESAVGIAKMIISNKAANIAALATPLAIATEGAAAIPVIAFNNITTAISVATSIAATAKALSALGGGGVSVPSIGGGGGGGTPSAPSSNGTPSITSQPQNTTTFTGNVNNNAPPIKTYVVETDLRNSTKTIDKIKEQSTY